MLYCTLLLLATDYLPITILDDDQTALYVIIGMLCLLFYMVKWFETFLMLLAFALIDMTTTICFCFFVLTLRDTFYNYCTMADFLRLCRECIR